MRYELAIDAQLLARSGVENITNGIRLAFWLKDHGMSLATEKFQKRHPAWAGVLRATELVFGDIPLASEITVVPHEVFGHGGRVREFGGAASFDFRPPPPYGFQPSSTNVTRPYVVTPDSQIIVSQAGIVVEGYEVHQVIVASFEANTLNHVDSGLIVGETIHEVFEASEPFKSGNDVRTWTQEMGFRHHASASALQKQYFVGTVISEMANPTFLYSAYDVFWRFVVRGKRTGPMPSIHVGDAAFWANTHVTPTPWGIQFDLTLLGRLRDQAVELAPHWGHGPGGTFAALDLHLTNAHVVSRLSIGGGLDFWLQPELSVVSQGVKVGEPGGGLGPLRPHPHDPTARPGGGGHVIVRWDEPRWYFGLRVDAKSAGLHGLSSIAPGADWTALVGLRLDRP